MELSCKLNCGTGARIGGWTQAYNPTCRPVESLVDRSVVVKQATCSASAWGRRLGGEAEVLKNGAAGFARGEDGEDTHAAATGVANQDDTGRRDDLRERAQRALPFVELAARHREHLDAPEPQVPESRPHRGEVEILLGRIVGQDRHEVPVVVYGG